MGLRAALIALALLVTPLASVTAQEAEAPMTPQRLVDILVALDPNAVLTGPAMVLTISDIPVTVFLDGDANRMRAMVPVASVESLTEADLLRVMQANFDTALDARYAIAQGRLWSVYVHPLAELDREQLIFGVGQAVNLARSYGTLYTGGMQIFGHGDSPEIYLDLFDDLLERGEEL